MSQSTQNISIRLAVVDGDRARRELTLTGEQGKRALERIRDATHPASRGLVAINIASQQLRTGMESLASQGTGLTASLARIGPAGLAAAAALGALTLGMGAITREAMQVEQANLRLSAVLRATGSAAGITKNEIDDLADRMEKTTMRTAEEVKDAASILLTFRSVTGDVFTDALKYAADAQTIFGGDLSSSVTRLGKALEDPVKGLSALTKVGITFTPVQQEMIRNFVETGRVADAQRVVLQAFEMQVGGTAAAERQGLAGAAKGLNDIWGELLESIGRTSGSSALAESSLLSLTGVINSLRKAIEPTASESKSQLEEEIASLEGSFGTKVDRFILGSAPVLDGKKRELRAINEALAAEAKKLAAEKEEAQTAADRTQLERRNEGLLQIEREFQKQLRDGTESERQKILREAAESKARVAALFQDDRSSDEASRAMAAVEAATRARLAKLDEAAARPINQMAEANRRFVVELAKRLELEQMGSREAAIQAELNRLQANATDQQRASVTQLAGAIYDLREAKKAEIAASREAEQAEREATRQREDAIRDLQNRLLEMMPAYEASLQAASDWRSRILEVLSTSAEDYERYRDQVERVFEELNRRAKDQSRSFEDGIERGLEKYADAATNAARNAEEALSRSMMSIEDAITDTFTNAELSLESFRDVARSIARDLFQTYMRQNVTGPLVGMLGDWMKGAAGGASSSSLFAGIYHKGGMVGESAVPMRVLPSQMFDHAPRFHNGLLPDEFPAILQRGETVLPKDSTIAAPPVEVQIVNVTNPDMIRNLIAESMTTGRTRQVIVNSVLQAMEQRGLSMRV